VGTSTSIWTEDSAALYWAPMAGFTRRSTTLGFLFQGSYAYGGEEFSALIDEGNKLYEEWAYGQHWLFALSGIKAGKLYTDVTDA